MHARVRVLALAFVALIAFVFLGGAACGKKKDKAKGDLPETPAECREALAKMDERYAAIPARAPRTCSSAEGCAVAWGITCTPGCASVAVAASAEPAIRAELARLGDECSALLTKCVAVLAAPVPSCAYPTAQCRDGTCVEQRRW